MPPRTAVGVWVICAETDEQAQYLAAPSRMTMRMLREGRLIPVPSPEKALSYLRSLGVPTDSGWLEGRRAIIGSPERVRAQLEEVADEYGAEEVIVVTITHDHQARRRSYELVAEAAGLEPRETASPEAPGAPAASAADAPGVAEAAASATAQND